MGGGYMSRVHTELPNLRAISPGDLSLCSDKQGKIALTLAECLAEIVPRVTALENLQDGQSVTSGLV